MAIPTPHPGRPHAVLIKQRSMRNAYWVDPRSSSTQQCLNVCLPPRLSFHLPPEPQSTGTPPLLRTPPLLAAATRCWILFYPASLDLLYSPPLNIFLRDVPPPLTRQLMMHPSRLYAARCWQAGTCSASGPSSWYPPCRKGSRRRGPGQGP